MYGTRFMSYLAYQYGPEKLIQWTTRSKGSKAYFASAFEQVYGLPLADSWQQWIQWEQQWQRANLDSVRLNPVTVDRPLAQRTIANVRERDIQRRCMPPFAIPGRSRRW